MSRAVLTLNNAEARDKLARWAVKLPDGTRVELKSPRRSLDQNALLWSLLSQVAAQVDWYGVKLSSEDWKLMFLDGLKRELRVVPNLDGNGFVNLGRSSSDLTVAEMTNLIELVFAFGAERGVVFRENGGGNGVVG